MNLKRGKSKTPISNEVCCEAFVFQSFGFVSNFGSFDTGWEKGVGHVIFVLLKSFRSVRKFSRSTVNLENGDLRALRRQVRNWFSFAAFAPCARYSDFRLRLSCAESFVVKFSDS